MAGGSSSPFATRADVEARFPREISVLASDERTRLVDTARVDASLGDASLEVRAILAGRYTPEQLAQLDAQSLGVLKLYTIDIALYRVALSFSRLTDTIRERYETAIKRLQDIASGRGGLSLQTGSAETWEPAAIAPNQVVLEGRERLFTRTRFHSVP